MAGRLVGAGTLQARAHGSLFQPPNLIELGAGRAGLIAASLGLSSFSLAGLYCNHADLSPRHASLLLGLTNTCGAIPGADP